MTAVWDRYWFGDVAAIRPYLLTKVLLCLVAFDVWMERVPLGGRYGAGEFGVAHFRWLDALQPLPSPGLYVGLMLAVGMLALVTALTDAGRWARALVALMYTYGWAMSLHDGYQHHYFLSLVLATFVVFPHLRARDLFATEATPPAPPAKKPRRARRCEPDNRRVCAWGYALLGATVGIVYAYTAATKWDPEWWAGDVMGRLGRKSFGSMAARLADNGVPPEMLWVVQGMSVFAVECLVAVGYVLAVRLDGSCSRSLRTVAWLAFLAAVGFHVSAEVVLSLRIGWFSYYMIALACVFFLPSSVLYRLGALSYRSTVRLAAVGSDFIGSARPSSDRLLIFAVVGVASVVAALGRSVELPGAEIAGLLAAAALLGTGAVTLVLGRHREVLRYTLATGLAAAFMWVAVAQSDVRPVYHTSVGQDLQKRGDLAGAAIAFERARRYAPDDRTIAKYVIRLERRLAQTEE